MVKQDKPLSEWTLGEATAADAEIWNIKIPPDERNLPETIPDKPRLAEVLGVEVGERFRLRGKNWVLYVTPIGVVGGVDESGSESEPMYAVVFDAINHPERIIRLVLTEPELAIMRTVGAKWVSKDDKSKADSVELWDEKPVMKFGFYGLEGKCPVATVKEDLFPSVHPGDCICAEITND